MNNENIIKRNNIDYRFKIMYTLGIIFVVAGHCGNGGVSIIYEWFPPYSFHLALFVFCSGYFYKENSESNISKYIIKKIKKLIVPLYLWNLLYALIVYISSLKGFTIGTGGNILMKLLILPIIDGHQFAYNMGGWFVVPLFVLEILNVLLRKVSKCFCKNDEKDIFCFFTYLLLGTIAVYIASRGYNQGIYLLFVRTLYLLPFYGFGILYKNVLERHDTMSNLKYFLIIFIINLIIIFIYGEVPSYTPSWGNDFINGPILPFIVGFLGIAFWFRISRILEPLIGKNKYINIIADNTYSIMINHFLGFMLVKTVFGLINKLTHICNNFNWFLYKNNIWYFYLPKGISQFYIIYLIAGIMVPIGIQCIINYFKRFGNKKCCRKKWHHELLLKNNILKKYRYL